MVLLFGSLAFFLLLGLPVFIALGLASLSYILAFGLQPLIAVQQIDRKSVV